LKIIAISLTEDPLKWTKMAAKLNGLTEETTIAQTLTEYLNKDLNFIEVFKIISHTLTEDPLK